MATPIPGRFLPTQQDAYNFYLSQIRITIERAFGILIHRWGVLCCWLLSMSILKVPSIVWCLMRLHNFCVDNDSRHTCRPDMDDERAIHRAACRMKGKPRAVMLNSRGTSDDLTGSGHHFRDTASARRPVIRTDGQTPMRKMIDQCLYLARPSMK